MKQAVNMYPHTTESTPEARIHERARGWVERLAG
jgi:hypothetical protein